VGVCSVAFLLRFRLVFFLIRSVDQKTDASPWPHEIAHPFLPRCVALTQSLAQRPPASSAGGFSILGWPLGRGRGGEQAVKNAA